MANGFAGSYPQNRAHIMNIVRIMRPQSILDIGVGTGYYGEIIRRLAPDIKLDGIEIWKDYENERWRCYDNIFACDIRDFDYGGYDLYLMVDIIEHLPRDDAYSLIDKINGTILISTPHHFVQEGESNPYQNHVSEWRVDDFKKYNIKDYSNYLSVIVVINNEKVNTANTKC